MALASDIKKLHTALMMLRYPVSFINSQHTFVHTKK